MLKDIFSILALVAILFSRGTIEDKKGVLGKNILILGQRLFVECSHFVQRCRTI